jgi:hypothetical protein
LYHLAGKVLRAVGKRVRDADSIDRGELGDASNENEDRHQRLREAVAEGRILNVVLLDDVVIRSGRHVVVW